MTPRASARGKVSLAIENRPPLLHRHAVLAGLCIGGCAVLRDQSRAQEVLIRRRQCNRHTGIRQVDAHTRPSS
jgi:hypothetical protein